MAQSLTSADSSRMEQAIQPMDISRSISDNDEDDDGIPHRVTQLEQEIHQLEDKLHDRLGTQQRLQQGLRPCCPRLTIPSKFKGMEAANDSDINATIRFENYAQIYAAIHKTGIPDNNNYMMSYLITTVLTQHHVSKGLKIYGDQGEKAVLQELQQLHDRMVIEPMQTDKLDEKDKQNALQYLMFLKQKRDGRIKGRGCADGRKQRVYMTKEEASAPTVSTKGLLLTCLIDAMEGRDVASVDIPGIFMQADMEGPDTYMKLEGKMVHLLSKIDPNLYTKFIKKENNRSVMYVKLKKALYGIIQASLLF